MDSGRPWTVGLVAQETFHWVGFALYLRSQPKRIISMILRQLGSNQTELSLNNGTSLFFSYETPVAGFSPDLGWFNTSPYYSRTTSKHINQYFKHAPKDKIRIVSDDVISEMCHPDDRIKV